MSSHAESFYVSLTISNCDSLSQTHRPPMTLPIPCSDATPPRDESTDTLRSRWRWISPTVSSQLHKKLYEAVFSPSALCAMLLAI